MKKIAILFFIQAFAFGAEVDTNLVRKHLNQIINTEVPRNYMNIDALNQVAAYIHDCFSQYGDSTVYQNFEVWGKTYKNVITSFGPKDAPRIIVGAHYDVCGDQDGADDNASGVVGLLEFARLLKDQELKYRVDLVAYSLEEPPFFGTENMGSYVHAEYLFDKNIPVYGMICMDMIGFYKEERKTQRYPLGLLKLFYGSRGDYVTIVRSFGGGKFSKIAKRQMKKSNFPDVKSIKVTKSFPGTDLSDHLNYWRFGFNAVFITDTGFYRNTNYHKPSDTIETLDIDRMAGAIASLYTTILTLAID